MSHAAWARGYEHRSEWGVSFSARVLTVIVGVFAVVSSLIEPASRQVLAAPPLLAAAAPDRAYVCVTDGLGEVPSAGPGQCPSRASTRQRAHLLATIPTPPPAGVPVASGPNVVLVGHSMLFAASWSIAESLPGLRVTNLAVPGEQMETIAARQGALPLLVTPRGGVVPEAGAVEVGVERGGWPLLQGPPSYQVLMVGTGRPIPGVLSLRRDPEAAPGRHSPADTYLFTRNAAGPAVAVARAVPLVFTEAAAHLDDIAVYWAGRNGSWTDAGAVDDRMALQLRMIWHQRPLDKRFLVIGEINAAGEPAAGPIGREIIAYNSAAQAKFGRRFIDLRTYLLTRGLTDAGVAATAQDARDLAAGIVPTSLRSDAIHLNARGSALVGKLVQTRLIELHWYAG